ncbi:MAG TPA: hydrogenase maturation protease [Candidatus Binataceae bacterium]|nr:hydrogenase maturation protease [Candidatus Binataceae bacterium]
MSKILVAGVGNIFLGDDGFGVDVAAHLRSQAIPAEVGVEDFGIRGVHLAYKLLEGYDLLIIVDALPLGAAPGTVCVFEPELDSDPVELVSDAHSLNPHTVLAMAKTLGARIGRVVVVGCEPINLTEGIGLSDPVAHAVHDAARVVRELINQELASRVEA